MNTFPIRRNPITFAWHFIKPNGEPFSLSGYDFDLYCWTGRGYNRVPTVLVTGEDMNILSWTMSKQEQVAPGNYDLSVVLKQNGQLFCKIKYQDAFALTRVLDAADGTEVSETSPQSVTIFSSAEFYVFEPIIPVVGENGNWYVNGEDTGKSAHSKITVIAEGENRGRIIFDEGEPEEVVYDGLKNALDTADTDHERAGEDHSTAAADHTTAEEDHERAGEDHSTAAADHTTAEEDHGRQVLSVTVEYAPGSSATVPPSSGWSTALPALTAGQFLWCRTTTVYNDNGKTPTVGYSVGLLTLLDGAVTINKLANEAKPVIISHTASELSITNAVPNALHIWNSPVSMLVINSLATPVHAEIANEYRFRFTTADDWDTENKVFPNSVKWVEEPYFMPNMTYEVSIENGLAISAEWENE